MIKGDLNFRFKLLVVVIFQLLAVLVIYISPNKNYQSNCKFSVNNDASTVYGLGRLNVIRKIKAQDGDFSLQVYADEFSIKNNKFGIFSTYISRKAHFKNLNIKIDFDSHANYTPKADFNAGEVSFRNYFSINNNKLSNKWLIDMDISNLFAIFIDDFVFELNDNGDNIIYVSSRRANTDVKNNSMLLEGRVVVITPCGSKLRANNVVWDIANNSFYARGPYILNEAENITSGKNFNLEYQTRLCKPLETIFFKEI